MRSADVLGRGARQNLIERAGAVEADDDRHPAGHGGRLESADLLHPAHVELDVLTLRRERVKTALGTPSEVDPKVGLGMGPGQTFVPGEVSGNSATEDLGPLARAGTHRRSSAHRGPVSGMCGKSIKVKRMGHKGRHL